jgi:uncharacterized membrane protein
VSALDLWLVLLSSVLHATWNVLAKRARDPLAFVAWLNVAWSLLTLPVWLAGGVSQLDMELAGLVAVSGLSHMLYQAWLATAYRSADLSLVYPISRSTPAFVALAAVPILGERIGLQGTLGIVTVMAGIWLVHVGPSLRWRALLSGGALYSYLTLAATVVYTLVDKLAMRWLVVHQVSSPSRSLLFFAAMSTATTLGLVPHAVITLPRDTFWRTLRDSRRDLLISGVIGLVSYVLILEAMRRSPVSYVTCVRQTSVLFAAWLSMRFLGEQPTRDRKSVV